MQEATTLPDRKLLTEADYRNAHLVHFKALVCYILNPNEQPSFQGEYNPRTICPELAKVLRAHVLFSRFAFIHEEVLPNGKPVLTLWLKENFDSHYPNWLQKKQANEAHRTERYAENERCAQALNAWVELNRRRKARTSQALLEYLFEDMMDEYRVSGNEATCLPILIRIGYITQPPQVETL